MTVPQVARRPNHDGVSPALDAPGDVEVLTAAPRLRLRPFSLPDDADDSEIRSPYSDDTPPEDKRKEELHG